MTGLDDLTASRRELASPHPSGKLVCVACAQRCKLADGARGVCLMRSRGGDALRVPWGYVAGLAVDPIEKKPFFHFIPGARALSFGMLGCDLHCPFCQNWLSSQTMRDPRARERVVPIAPAALVAAAIENACAVITSTYNEPLITAEWSHDVFALAHAAGVRTAFVSNGQATREVIDYLAPVLDAFKVDLKAFRTETYRALGGHLEAVKETIVALHGRGLWVEVVTLVVPGMNDSDTELAASAAFLAGVSPDLPWHLTAFHPDYRMTGPPPTPAATLRRAVEIGRRAGLRHVYAGNLGGRSADLEETRCPQCGDALVARRGFTVERCTIHGGRCPGCGTAIAGIWDALPQPRNRAAGTAAP